MYGMTAIKLSHTHTHTVNTHGEHAMQSGDDENGKCYQRLPRLPEQILNYWPTAHIHCKKCVEPYDNNSYFRMVFFYRPALPHTFERSLFPCRLWHNGKIRVGFPKYARYTKMANINSRYVTRRDEKLIHLHFTAIREKKCQHSR